MDSSEPDRSHVVNEVLLRRIAHYLSDTKFTTRVSVFPPNHRESIVAEIDTVYDPDHVHAVRLDIRAYLNEDFHVMYIEQHEHGQWKCRWDSHPNPHNSRTHFHPPPDAATETAADRDFPEDFFEVIRLVLAAVETRIGESWSAQ